MLHLGLDVHSKQSKLAFRNDDGKELSTETVRGPWDQVLARLRRLDEPFQVCYEASCGYGALYDRLSAVAQRVVVAHPGKLRLIFQNKRKNDRTDAQTLCKLLYLDAVPPVHVPRAEVRAWRALIEHRQRLIRRRVQVKNQIRALLRGHGLACPHRLWTKKGLAWLTALSFAAAFDAFRRDQLLEELRHLGQQVRRAEDQLSQVAAPHPGVTLLQTIPGVGPPTVRKLLTEASWQAIRRSGRVKAKYERLLNNDPQRRKIALVAISHFLVRAMWSMLVHQRPWQEESARAA
jgi:transposase